MHWPAPGRTHLSIHFFIDLLIPLTKVYWLYTVYQALGRHVVNKIHILMGFLDSPGRKVGTGIGRTWTWEVFRDCNYPWDSMEPDKAYKLESFITKRKLEGLGTQKSLLLAKLRTGWLLWTLSSQKSWSGSCFCSKSSSNSLFLPTLNLDLRFWNQT